MSAEPVAWMDNLGRIVRRIDIEAGGVVGTERAIPDNWTPLQSPSVARAMAIAEAARVCEQWQREYEMDACCDDAQSTALKAASAAIRSLSPAPSVTEEWVNERILSVFDKRPETADLEARYAVRATLAALGVKVEGAAK